MEIIIKIKKYNPNILTIFNINRSICLFKILFISLQYQTKNVNIMTTVSIILLVISLGIFFGLLFGSENIMDTFLGWASGCLLFISLNIMFEATNVKKPTAIDVYRNKTTLQITYQDSVVIDSVVVFKSNLKHEQ